MSSKLLHASILLLLARHSAISSTIRTACHPIGIAQKPQAGCLSRLDSSTRRIIFGKHARWQQGWWQAVEQAGASIGGHVEGDNLAVIVVFHATGRLMRIGRKRDPICVESRASAINIGDVGLISIHTK